MTPPLIIARRFVAAAFGDAFTICATNPPVKQGSFSVSAQDLLPEGLAFKSDGTKVYFIGNQFDRIRQYPLSTAWDITTAGALEADRSHGADQNQPTGLKFSLGGAVDGQYYYFIGTAPDVVNQFELGTPWDFSGTETFITSLNVATETGNPEDLAFKSNGTKLYVLGSGIVFQYALTTPWFVNSVGSPKVETSFSVVAQDSVMAGLTFNADGTKMYTTGDTNDSVYEYDLSTPWEVDTASFLCSFSVSADEADPTAIYWQDDGTNFFITGTQSDSIIQYKAANTSAFSEFFVAVGGTVIETSDDSGETWTTQTTPMGITGLNDVAYDGSGTWVAVGSGGEIITSDDDGVTWDTRVSGTAQTLRSVYYDYQLQRWLAVGESGETVKSDNGGVNWSVLPTSAFGSSTMTSNFHDGTPTSRWVATTSNDTFVSTNGATWFSVGRPLGAANVDWVDLGHNKLRGISEKRWLIVGGRGTGSGMRIAKSPTGSSWSEVTTPYPSTTGSFRGVASNRATEEWVTVGDSGRIAYSDDNGDTFTAIAGSPVVTSNQLNEVATDGKTWITVGNSGTILKSTDKVTWTSKSNGFGATNVNGIAAKRSQLFDDAQAGLGSPVCYQTEVELDGPFAYWKFDEVSGTTAVDSAGSNNGTYTNGPVLGNAAIINDSATSSVGFDGINDHVQMGVAGDLDPDGDFTWECWMDTVDGEWRLMDTRGTGVFGTQAGVQISVTGGGPSWGNTAIDDGAGNFVQFLLTTYTQDDGNPHHIVLTWDDTNGIAELWIDGEAEQVNQDDALIGAAAAGSLDSGRPFRVGIPSNTTASQQFSGNIDEVAIYKRVLKPIEIKQHYQAGATFSGACGASLTYEDVVFADGPVGYWQLGESFGSPIPVAADSSGNGYDASYFSGVGLGTTAVTQNTSTTAVNMASDNFIEVDTDGFFAQNGPNDKGSIEFWMIPNFSTGDGFDRLFWGGGAGSNTEFVRFQHFTDNKYYCGWIDPPTDDRIIVAHTVAPMTINEEYHWVYTWDQTASEQILYQNGVQVAIRSAAFTVYTAGATNFRFASNETETPGPGGFGIFDECAIYDHVLSPARILAHWNKGKTGSP